MNEVPDDVLSEAAPAAAEEQPVEPATGKPGGDKAPADEASDLPPAVFFWHNDDTYHIPWVPAW